MLNQLGYNTTWFNADVIRDQYNDWDFSYEGRLRQATRMKELCDNSTADLALCDFVCPLPEFRDAFKPDYIIWLDRPRSIKYHDTLNLFMPPDTYDLRLTRDDELDDEFVSSLANQIGDYYDKTTH